jgi:uncharacterized protein (TIGR03437 family)
VGRNGHFTNEIRLQVQSAVPAPMPGLWDSVYNSDWSRNSELNPAKPGDVVTVFLSGAGQLSGIRDDAAAVSAPPPALAAPVTAFISGSGGQQVTFAGGVPGQLPGLVQVNVRIGADFIFHGRMLLEIAVGDAETLVELWIR